MLVIISDLHFTDATAGRHNLPAEAFEDVFLSDIVELAKKKKAKELKLLLLGDIPDLIRSAQWLDVPPENRPWGRLGLDDVANWYKMKPNQQPTATEQLCLNILGQMPSSEKKEDVAPNTILYQNWETFAFFRDFRRTMQARVRYHLGSIPVQLEYIPGNHDRLVNLYPSVRDELKKILGLTISEETIDGRLEGRWWYPYEFMDETYGVYARHGHQFDLWNYGGGNDLSQLVAHLQIPIGDVLATEFAVRLPWEAVRYKDVLGETMIERLQDMDNVRPLSRLLEWFYYEMEQDVHPRIVRDALDEIADNVVKNLVALEFVQNWRTPLSSWDEQLRTIPWLPQGLAGRIGTLGMPGPDELVRAATSPALRWLVKKLADVTDSNNLLRTTLFLTGRLQGHGEADDRDEFLRAAYREHVWRSNNNINMILYGHTHAPGVFILDGANHREVLYVNTGTWRERIQRTISLDRAADFIKMKQMTYVIVYGPEEDGGGPDGNKQPGTVSFDMWTGNKLKHYR